MGWPLALRELKELLYEVYLAAGAPSLDEISRDIAGDDGLAGSPSRDTVHRVITDGERPRQQADVVAVATVLARRAAGDAPDLARRVRELWVQARMAQGAGRPISDLRDDLRLVLDGGLGIHPALDADGAHDRFGILPAYIPRDHDARLKEVVGDAAEARRSGIAILVGESSTGKTRALWEAVGELPDDWRLWHPLSPTAPEAALTALPDIAPKTVVWLNEAQLYLNPDPLGERVAAGLRELLHDPSRAPVLVLGTLWSDHWDTLTTRTNPDRHCGARDLLAGHKIDVPSSFTPADLAALDAANDADPRLAQAAQRAKGAQITQYLAGVPYLMGRYSAARGAALALIHAAMDARRLGAGPHIPRDWLANAALGYLDNDDEYHTLDDDWLTQALTYVTRPVNGIPGILTPVTNSGPRNQRTRYRPAASDVPADRPAPSSQGPRYLLADYLDQHGRHHRAEIIPPIDFWTAAAHHTDPADLTALANAAWDRGLYRDAAQLHKHATTHGDPHAAVTLIDRLHILHPTDHHAAQWAAAHAALDNPVAIATLLRAMQRAGAHAQVTALAERAATHAALDNPRDVARLLGALQRAGADAQVTVLLARAPAAHAALDNPGDVVWLLGALREAGADEQVSALLARAPAAHAALNNSGDVAALLAALQRAGADEQVTALAERAAAHAALDDPSDVASLLGALREAGADAQVTVLLARDPAAHVSLDLDDPDAVAWLLQTLWEDGAHDQVTVLAERATPQVGLDDWGDAVYTLLQAMQRVGADEQVTALLAELAAAHVPLDDTRAVVWVLSALREAGADAQVTVLLARDPARHVPLDDMFVVASLLDMLRRAGADEQVTALLARDPARHVPLDDMFVVASLLDTLRWAGADAQVTVLLARDPAAHAGLDTPERVAKLLAALQRAGAHVQVTALAERVVAHAALDNPEAVAKLLAVLQRAGAHVQVTALAERAVAHAALDNPGAVGWLLSVLREAGADEQVTVLLARDPATHAGLDNPGAVALLLSALQRAGADEQVTVLLARDPAAHVALDNPEGVALLLSALREAGTHAKVTALLARDPATHLPLDLDDPLVPFVVARLVSALREAGAHAQVTALAERAVAHVPLDYQVAIVELLQALREAGAHAQVTTLAERLPAAGHFGLFITLGGNRKQFRLGREPDGSAAPSWTWNDMD
ncbi:hypothetical protein [Streptomyces mirabilis]|uniref:hypothetical protein n=1 Tax=Streptomyces mirabilis TaxID=68239 RepID=UPI0036CFACD8